LKCILAKEILNFALGEGWLSASHLGERKHDRKTVNSPPPTAQQQRAISARGNVLVVAGAGAGKTQPVVDRCLAWLLDEGNAGSIDQILMVTFTQAAATEMRQRLRQSLEEAQARLGKSGPPPLHLAEQLALLDTAHIGTLHSFCLHLVSRHFHDLGLDPKGRVLPEERAQLLARQSLDHVLDKTYASESLPALAIQQLIQAQGGDWDLPVRELILRLHDYSQTLRDPEAWFAGQTALFQQREPAVWLGWLMDELANWRKAWLPVLQTQPAANKNAAQCAQALAALPEKPDRSSFASALEAIGRADADWPRPKGLWRDPIEKMFDEADFLRSVCAVGEADPLVQDWFWARPPMLALLDLAGQFGRVYQEAKRQEGGLDYHDLEQFALRLLWKNGRPSGIAEEWRGKLRLVFVDEYQDINEAQEAIIQALGREGAGANRFLVGDVKQSIYGFRLADPRIFGKYQEAWTAGPAAQVIPLTENFRSHEAILHFVNALFEGLMRKETGGVGYDADARLLFGNAAGRAHLAARAASPPPVELHLRCLGREGEDTESAESASDAEKEARLVGRRLMELKNQGTLLFDRAGQQHEVKWNDMVVLLRSPRHKVEAYAKEFGRLGIPLSATRGGFYESLEVRDLLGLLQVLDNPLQDLPLLGVLRSPLVGLTADELAVIRIGREHGRFWDALLQWHKTTEIRAPHYDKTHEFLRRFEDWRKLSRQSAVSHCLECVIDQTHYGDWIATQERGEQKRANVERLLQLTRQFDAYDGESLYRFLRFVEAQQESEAAVEPAAAPAADAVRLMSIHQSKGLEFPIVAAADLGKLFNFSDLHHRIILDEEYGLSPQIQPPETPQFYPSLPWWLAQRRQKRKMLGEEMRLLYVAMTRAGQRLILAGTTGKNSLEKKWPLQAERGQGAAEILAARNYLDWLGPWLVRTAGATALTASGNHALLSWTLYDENDPRVAPAEDAGEPAAAEATPAGPDIAPALRDRLSWRYPFQAETLRPAKTSVTTIRRQITDEDGGESFPLFAPPPARAEPRKLPGLSAAEIGLAHHAFLQLVSLDKVQTSAGLKTEAARLGRQNLLTRQQIACLDFEALAAFWQSEAGRQLLGQSGHLERELAFTARFSAADLQQLGCAEFAGVGPAEFVVVQGVMDLVAILPGEIWLLDFKTDRFPAGELEEKIRAYRPQLALYAQALERIHRRPVTKRWLHFLALRQTALL
jgi:ATP-dependent helicase/nuclease subunit A